MPFTDKTGKVWPDRMERDGVKLILVPAASLAAKNGKPVYTQDPQQKKEFEQANGFAPKDPKQTSMGEGLAQIGAVAGTSVLAQQLATKGGNLLGADSATPPSPAQLQEAAKGSLADSAANVQTGNAPVATPTGGMSSPAPGLVQQADGTMAIDPTATAGPTPGTIQLADGRVVNAPEGTVVGNDGSLLDMNTGLKVVQGAMGAYQVYQGIQDFKNDKIGGSLGVGSGVANIGGAMGNQTLGSAAGPLQAATGGYQVVKGFNQGGEGVRSGMTNLGAGIGTMILPGVGTAVGAVGGNVLGYGLQGSGWKNDLALGAMTGGLSYIPGVGDGIRGLIHKTTGQVQQEHTQDLLKQGADNQAYQDYVAGMRQGYGNGITGPAYAGKYNTWDEYKAAGLQANDLTGVYGNIKTFGTKWTDLTEEKRQQVTQKLIDAGLYQSKKGEIEITDPDAAQKIFDETVAAKKKEELKKQQLAITNNAANVQTGSTFKPLLR